VVARLAVGARVAYGLSLVAVIRRSFP